MNLLSPLLEWWEPTEWRMKLGDAMLARFLLNQMRGFIFYSPLSSTSSGAPLGFPDKPNKHEWWARIWDRLNILISFIFDDTFRWGCRGGFVIKKTHTITVVKGRDGIARQLKRVNGVEKGQIYEILLAQWSSNLMARRAFRCRQRCWSLVWPATNCHCPAPQSRLNRHKNEETELRWESV